MPGGDEIFWWYGVGLIAALGLTMFVPFWRRRADALTAWNLFLLGSIIHIGVGCMEVWAKKMHWPELTWFEPNSHEIRWFLTGTTVFYGSLIFFHFKFRLPDRILQTRLSKWPELSSSVVLFMLAICVGGVSILPLVENVPFVREVAVNFSHSALAIAVTFTTVYWLRNRLSPFAMLLMFAALGVAAIEAMVTYAGRRLLLTVAMGPVAAVYWISWRYWARTKLVAIFGSLAVGFIILSGFYATFRWERGERTASTIIARAKSVTGADVRNQLSDMYHYLGQYTVHYSLLTIRLVDEGRLNVIPLDTLRHIVNYPIPRSVWPDKPRDECQWVSTEVLHMPYKTNWGVGVTGQGYHDGGYEVLILYALLISTYLKCYDVPLSRQPGNPFLLSALAAGSAHIAAWPRGGLAAMTLNVVESFVVVLVLAFVCRALFGTARNHAGAGYGWPAQAYYPRH